MDEPTEPHTPDADFFMAALSDAARPDGGGFPGYTVLGEISRGGMGAVYHAVQEQPRREVALKALLPRFAEDQEMLARFQLEARAMAALDHPGILPVFEVGEADETPFFSMKLADGGTLAGRLRDGPLPPREAAELMVDLARAVHHAHQHGVLHRDLKPANFLFTADGRAFVSDFGLAKLTTSGQAALTNDGSFFGTPLYMPPEVAAGSAVDATVAGDIYSMGAVLYECLIGEPPHVERENAAALLRAIADEPVKHPTEIRPGIPRDLSVICMKALEFNPHDRFPTLADFADDLERWLDGMPIRARPAGVMEILWRWACRHPLPASLIAILAVVLAGGGALLALSNAQRGEALADARRKLHRSLIDQARAERLLGAPGHRERALALLRQAAGIGGRSETRGEAASLFARPDLCPEPVPAPPREQAPSSWKSEDPVRSWITAPDGRTWLSFHESGSASLGREDVEQAIARWQPAEGREIAAEFTGTGLLLAETGSGILLENYLSPGSPEVVAAAGAVVRFVSAEPRGSRVALARVDGVTVIDPANPAAAWHHGTSPARCPAAWTEDGSRLAVALGDRHEALILSASDGAVLATIPLGGIPRQLAFNPAGNLLAAAGGDGEVSLCDPVTGAIWCSLPHAAHEIRFDPGGHSLMTISEDGSEWEWKVEMPLAFEDWTEIPRVATDGLVSGMAVSPDGRRLLTVSAGQVALWSLDLRRQTGLLGLENQRIDDRASAWWLGDDEFLVQVPGGLERVVVSAEGRPGEPVRVPRVPGSSVIHVEPDGSWVVSVLDEDGGQSHERWPDGDETRAVPLDRKPVIADSLRAGHHGWSAVARAGPVIDLKRADGAGITMIPPGHDEVAELVFSHDGGLLIGLTKSHRVFSWDLSSLERGLAGAGF